VTWFDRALALNRWDVHSYIRKGMCLDWLDENEQADPLFKRAVELDPNHYFSRAMMGWHLFHSERYAECIDWMNRSLELNNTAYNTVAYSFRDLAKKALEQKTDSTAIRPPAL
jgi:tetratricopeptide (TPR) repeat protein